MKGIPSPQAAERAFFRSLVEGDLGTLDRILSDDFILVDVMQGGEIPKPALMDAIRSGQVVFQAIDPDDARVRLYGTTAVINGRTQMRGRVAGVDFTVKSRYTHVYAETGGGWRLVAAQGTRIAGDSASS